jgi:TolB-like protein/lipoprotein NlpI
MASVISGFDYDVFISYRQKDNKGDSWVSDFVEDLNTELDKTFKEEISVYFDINPHDGLLETYDVDASLREKLKCLVFIPIISRTYCDPKSFAWEHEFKVFVNQASHDTFGLKIRLPAGNVANRVIPVRIYDLDLKDTKLCESILGGSIRGIDFIYKEPGVNRPMTRWDNEEKNLNSTNYRNQINRVANAIKEIIYGLKTESLDYDNLQREVISSIEKSSSQDKTIIVLPFENISSDPGQQYFSDGLTDEIISDLSLVPELLVISRSSAMTFRGSRNTIREIAEKVNVRYVLEGSVRKELNNLRIFAQLIDSSNDSHIWAEKYAGTLEDVFDIQEKVSKSIVSALKISLNSRGDQKIRERSFENAFAFDCYKKAFPEIASFNRERIEHGLNLLQKGLDIEGANAMIYAGMAFAYLQYVNAGIEQEKNIKLSEEYVRKAFSLNPDLAEANFVMAWINTFTGKPDKAMENILRAHKAKPEDPEIMIWLAFAYTQIGRIEAAKSAINKCVRIDPVNPMIDTIIAWNHFYDGKFDLSLDPMLAAYNLIPESRTNQFWKSFALLYNGRSEEAYEFICKCVEEPPTDSWSQLGLFLKYAIIGEKDKINQLVTPDFIKIHQRDPQNSYIISALYSSIGERQKSLKWLEKAVEQGFMNFPFLNEYDPLLQNIRGEERFKILMKRVKQRWERFEVYCSAENEKSDRLIGSDLKD